jgi:hypothetical protein
LISDCYWEGGGKAGQFPAWFKNKRGEMTNSNGGKFNTSANVTLSTDNTNQDSEPHVYALSSITKRPYQVAYIEPIPRAANPDDCPNSRTLEKTLNVIIRGKELGYVTRNLILDTVLAMSSIITANDHMHLLTLLDLGATDHCFVNTNNFSTYKPYPPPRDGHLLTNRRDLTLRQMGRLSCTSSGMGEWPRFSYLRRYTPLIFDTT